jgi:multidrug efflux system membrane fusion protein
MRQAASIAVSSLCAVTLALTVGCDRQSGAAPAAAAGRPPSIVVAADVVAQDVPVYLDEIGTCTAREMVSIEPQVSGRITEIQFVDGANLKKGDPLFTIDPRPYEAELAAAEALYEKDKALAANAEAIAARQKQIFQQKLISPADYDQARYTADAQDATVKIDAAAVQTAKLNLEYCSIVSPIDGRAGHRLVDVGNVMRSDADLPLLTIQRLDPIYVDFTATEGDLPAVRSNMEQGLLRVVASIPSGSVADGATGNLQASREGTLTFLDNAVTNGSGTIKLRATIPNSDHLFWPGQFVQVRLILKTLKAVPVVPADALQLSQQGTFVYVINPADSTVQPRPVKVGQRQGDHGEMVAIESGLAAGEKVVVTGQLTLGPGAKVTLEAPATQPAAEVAKS